MKAPRFALSAELVKLVGEIDEFKGRWQALERLSPDRLLALRKVATIESIGSSTRIEGAKLSDVEVETLLSNLGRAAFASRDEEEVAGYAEAMDLVFEAWEDLRLTLNHVRQLHQTLLRHSERDERHRGEWKTQPNHVVAFDARGRELGVVFETASPFDTPARMEVLVEWTSRSLDERAMHPLLIVSTFVVTFLAIHPFQDGNGRLSRVLTTLLLLRAGYDYVPYVSLESVIEANKDLYYKALRRTQGTLDDDAPDWEPWTGFFLRSLKKQKDRLARKLEADGPDGVEENDLPALSVQVIAALARHGRRSGAELAESTGANRSTLKLRLRELVESGRVRRHGKGRATWYTL